MRRVTSINSLSLKAKQIFACLVSGLIAMAGTQLHGQGVTGNFSDSTAESVGSFFDVENNLQGWFKHVAGRQVGGTQPFTGVGANRYLFRDNGVLMAEGQFWVTNDGDLGATSSGHRPFGNPGCTESSPGTSAHRLQSHDTTSAAS